MSGATWGWSDHERAEAERLDSHIAAVAASLRSMANKVERYREVRPNIRTMEPDYTRAAVGVTHEVMWGIANLHLDSLVKIAADVTAARRSAQGESGADAAAGSRGAR